MRLLHQFQLELPSCWIRFQEQMVQEIMESTLQLVQSSIRNNTASSGAFSALHCMSLVDTKCSWFEKWALSNFGRCQIIISMTKIDLVSELFNCFLKYTTSIISSESNFHTKFEYQNASGHLNVSDEVLVMDVDMNDDEEYAGKKIHRDDLEYSYFLHVLYLTTRLSSCADMQKKFPLTLDFISPHISGSLLEKTILSSTGKEMHNYLSFHIKENHLIRNR